MAAMESSGYIKLQGKVDVEEFFIGGFEEGKTGRSEGKKKAVVMGIQMQKKRNSSMSCHAYNRLWHKAIKAFF